MEIASGLQTSDYRLFVRSVRAAAEISHRQLLTAARLRWEQYFGAADPADACVSVRIRGNRARA